jgi:hypothetical protein
VKRLERERANLAKAIALHQAVWEQDNGIVCDGCSQRWPCTTQGASQLWELIRLHERRERRALDSAEVCVECQSPWPCATYRAATAEEENEELLFH